MMTIRMIFIMIFFNILFTFYNDTNKDNLE